MEGEGSASTVLLMAGTYAAVRTSVTHPSSRDACRGRRHKSVPEGNDNLGVKAERRQLYELSSVGAGCLGLGHANARELPTAKPLQPTNVGVPALQIAPGQQITCCSMTIASTYIDRANL